ncbi:MAG: hypothetical protein WBA45_04040 [Microthrixaceae bacterium]
MLLLATEKVWHFWIAVPLALTAVLIVAAIVGLYVTKVSRTRYRDSHS